MKKLLLALLLGAVIAPTTAQALTDKQPLKPRRQCGEMISGDTLPGLKTPTFRFTQSWIQGPVAATDWTAIEDVNGVALWTVANLFARKSRLPTPDEVVAELRAHLPRSGRQDLQRRTRGSGPQFVSNNILEMIIHHGMKHYYEQKGAAHNIEDLARIAIEKVPSVFVPLKTATYKKVRDFFVDHLRAPTLTEAARAVSINVRDFTLLVGSGEALWHDTVTELPITLVKARDLIAKTYLRVVDQRDVPANAKTRATNPTLEEMWVALRRVADGHPLAQDIDQGVFTKNDFLALLGLPPESAAIPAKKPTGPAATSIARPVLYPSGLTQVEARARRLQPLSFANFLDRGRFGVENSQKLIAAVVAANGFLVTTATAEVPIDEWKLNIMLKIAKERDCPVIVIPTNQIFDGLDEKLFKNPRIFILNHTIENDALRLSNISIGPKNMNPFASLDKKTWMKPGQLAIVGHPQQTHLVVPALDNHIAETQLWSPGSISKELYPFRVPIQGRTSNIAKRNHTPGFLIVEKASRYSGMSKRGTTNQWHVRNVEFFDDRKAADGTDLPADGIENLGAGAIDMGRFYSHDGRVEKYDALAGTPGDIHDEVASQRLERANVALIRALGIRRIIWNDPIDGGAANRHEKDNVSLLAQKLRAGQLDLTKENNRFAARVNTYAALGPFVEQIVLDSNHSYWQRELANNPSLLQQVVNANFINEYNFVRSLAVPTISDPLAYFIHRRNDVINSLPADMRDSGRKDMITIDHPERVAVLPAENYVLGPAWRPVHYVHGHKGANGAKGANGTHPNSGERIVGADSHNRALLNGYYNPGTSLPRELPYMRGNASGWTQGMVVQYPNGMLQLMSFNGLADEYFQDRSQGEVGGEEFFGGMPLVIRENDNDVLPGVSIHDQHSAWRRYWLNDGRP